MIREQKAGMVRDMVALLRMRDRFSPRYSWMRIVKRGAAPPAATSGAEATARAGNRSSDESVDGGKDGVLGSSGDNGVAHENTSTSGSAATDDSSAAECAAANNAAGAAAAGAGAVPAAGGSVAGPLAAGTGRGVTAAAANLQTRLLEQLVPRSDASVWAVVQQELQHAGGFQPLMPLFPIGRSALVSDGSFAIPWHARDLEMPAMMRRVRRKQARAGQAGGRGGAAATQHGSGGGANAAASLS